jgi:hypothetical protein
VAARFEPVVEVDLLQVGGQDFFTQFVRFDRKKWHAKFRKSCDERLCA